MDLYKITISLSSKGYFKKVETAEVSKITEKTIVLKSKRNSIHRTIIRKCDLDLVLPEPYSSHLDRLSRVVYNAFTIEDSKIPFLEKRICGTITQDFNRNFNEMVKVQTLLLEGVKE